MKTPTAGARSAFGNFDEVVDSNHCISFVSVGCMASAQSW